MNYTGREPGGRRKELRGRREILCRQNGTDRAGPDWTQRTGLEQGSCEMCAESIHCMAEEGNAVRGWRLKSVGVGEQATENPEKDSDELDQFWCVSYRYRGVSMGGPRTPPTISILSLQFRVGSRPSPLALSLTLSISSGGRHRESQEARQSFCLSRPDISHLAVHFFSLPVPRSLHPCCSASSYYPQYPKKPMKP